MKRLASIALLLMSFTLIGMEGPRKNTPYKDRNEIGRLPSLRLTEPYSLYFTWEAFRLGSQNTPIGTEYLYYRIPSFQGDSGSRMVDMVEAFSEVRPSIQHSPKEEEKRIKRLIKKFTEYFAHHPINEGIYYLYRPGVTLNRAEEIASVGNITTHFNGRAGDIWSRDELRPAFFVRVTPLQIAAMAADWAAIEWLLRHGANPQGTTPDVPQTPLELLTTLVRYEQEELGKEHGESRETIERNQQTAAEFAQNEWSRVVERSSGSHFFEDAQTMLSNILHDPKTPVYILFALLLYLVWQKKVSSLTE